MSGTTGPLDEIREKYALLKRVEAEHGFGVVLADGVAQEPVPDLPTGVTEVFSVFSRIRGDYFVFAAPPEIAGPSAWRDRVLVPDCPMGNPLAIGHEIHGMSELALQEVGGGGPISMDIDDGGVYYLDPDDYVFLYKHPDEDIEIEDLAPDIVTFFNDVVFGEHYLELVRAVLGLRARDSRQRKGRFKGQHRDSWMRLLVAAGLATDTGGAAGSPESAGRHQHM